MPTPRPSSAYAVTPVNVDFARDDHPDLAYSDRPDKRRRNKFAGKARGRRDKRLAILNSKRFIHGSKYHGDDTADGRPRAQTVMNERLAHRRPVVAGSKTARQLDIEIRKRALEDAKEVRRQTGKDSGVAAKKPKSRGDFRREKWAREIMIVAKYGAGGKVPINKYTAAVFERVIAMIARYVWLITTNDRRFADKVPLRTLETLIEPLRKVFSMPADAKPANVLNRFCSDVMSKIISLDDPSWQMATQNAIKLQMSEDEFRQAVKALQANLSSDLAVSAKAKRSKKQLAKENLAGSNTKRMIQLLLQMAGIEPNPGPFQRNFKYPGAECESFPSIGDLLEKLPSQQAAVACFRAPCYDDRLVGVAEGRLWEFELFTVTNTAHMWLYRKLCQVCDVPKQLYSRVVRRKAQPPAVTKEQLEEQAKIFEQYYLTLDRPLMSKTNLKNGNCCAWELQAAEEDETHSFVKKVTGVSTDETVPTTTTTFEISEYDEERCGDSEAPEPTLDDLAYAEYGPEIVDMTEEFEKMDISDDPGPVVVDLTEDFKKLELGEKNSESAEPQKDSDDEEKNSETCGYHTCCPPTPKYTDPLPPPPSSRSCSPVIAVVDPPDEPVFAAPFFEEQTTAPGEMRNEVQFHGRFAGWDSTYSPDDPVILVKRDGENWYHDAGGAVACVRVTHRMVQLGARVAPAQDRQLRFRNLVALLGSDADIAKAMTTWNQKQVTSFLQNKMMIGFLLTGCLYSSGDVKLLSDVDGVRTECYECDPISDEDKQRIDKLAIIDTDLVKNLRHDLSSVRAAPIYAAGFVAYRPATASVTNIYACLNKRILPPKLPVTDEVIEELEQLSDDLVDYIRHHTNPETLESVDHLCQEALRYRPIAIREGYQKGFDAWDSDYENSIITMCSTAYKSFYKNEILPFNERKPPRVIMTLPLEQRGMQLRALCQILRQIEVGTATCNVKHLTPWQITQKVKDMFADQGDVYETDHSSFESCISPTIKAAVENRIFAALATTGSSEEYVGRVCSRRTVKVIGNGFTIPKCPFQRMSGDQQTSLGNLVTNIVVSAFILERPIDWVCQHCLFEGDDGLLPVCAEQSRMEMRAKMCGMRLKLKRAPWSQLSFCGNHFEECEGSLQLVRDPQRVIAQLSTLIDCNPGTRKHDITLQRAKALSVLSGPWIRDASAFAAVIERATRGHTVSQEFLIARDLMKPYDNYRPEGCVPRFLLVGSDYVWAAAVAIHDKFSGGTVSVSDLLRMLKDARDRISSFRPEPVEVPFLAPPNMPANQYVEGLHHNYFHHFLGVLPCRTSHRGYLLPCLPSATVQHNGVTVTCGQSPLVQKIIQFLRKTALVIGAFLTFKLAVKAGIPQLLGRLCAGTVRGCASLASGILGALGSIGKALLTTVTTAVGGVFTVRSCNKASEAATKLSISHSLQHSATQLSVPAVPLIGSPNVIVPSIKLAPRVPSKAPSICVVSDCIQNVPVRIPLSTSVDAGPPTALMTRIHATMSRAAGTVPRRLLTGAAGFGALCYPVYKSGRSFMRFVNEFAAFESNLRRLSAGTDEFSRRLRQYFRIRRSELTLTQAARIFNAFVARSRDEASAFLNFVSGVNSNAESASTSAVDVKSTPTTPAVVSTTRGTSLADKLDLKNLPLAATPGGRVFAMKALHPSDHEIKVSRVPGGNRLSVALCSDQVQTINLTNAGSEVGITVTPHPIVPCAVDVLDGGTTTYYSFLNAALGGTVRTNMTTADNTLYNVLQRWSSGVEMYRVTSQSVTVELIAPTLSDQGTITAAQYNCPPRTAQGTITDSTIGAGDGVTLQPDYLFFDKPVTTPEMVLGTQAYTAKAREGCYMPLKLTRFKWQHVNDCCMYGTINNIDISQHCKTKVQYTALGGWPLYVSYAGVSDFGVMHPLPKWCGCNFGVIAIQGCAANVAVRVRVRQVLEVACRPSSTYAPLVEVPLPPDETAIKMYFEISARMADGYPAVFNDLGRLKAIVQGLAKKVAPFVEPALTMLSAAPGPVGAIASTAKTALPIVRGVVNTIKANKQAAAKKR